MLNFEWEQGYGRALTQEYAAGGSQIKREGRGRQAWKLPELEGSAVREKSCLWGACC